MTLLKGMTELHKVRARMEFISRSKLLPPGLAENYPALTFWPGEVTNRTMVSVAWPEEPAPVNSEASAQNLLANGKARWRWKFPPPSASSANFTPGA